MPQKREVLQLLSRDELATIVDRFELSPADRRSKDALMDAVASSKKATLDAYVLASRAIGSSWWEGRAGDGRAAR